MLEEKQEKEKKFLEEIRRLQIKASRSKKKIIQAEHICAQLTLFSREMDKKLLEIVTELNNEFCNFTHFFGMNVAYYDLKKNWA